MEEAIDGSTVDQLINDLSAFENEPNSYGVRDLMNKIPSVRTLACSPPLIDIAKKILGESARAVRTVYFDKLPEPLEWYEQA